MTEFTQSNRLRLIGTGEMGSRWGSVGINTNLDLIDESADGVASVAVSLPETVIQSRDGYTAASRKRIVVLTGSLSGDAKVIVPNASKWWTFVNRCTGGNVSVGTRYGRSVAVSGTAMVVCDGVDCTAMSDASPERQSLEVVSGYLSAGDGAKVAYSVSDLTLPLLSSVPVGWCVDVRNASASDLNVVASGSDAFDGSLSETPLSTIATIPISTLGGDVIVAVVAGGNSASVGAGDCVRVVSIGSAWITLFGRD